MRSKTAQKLFESTSNETREFVSLYSAIVVRINELIAEKGYTQKQLAESIGKKPSEISKWLNGEHNFTLRSIAKLQAQLGETIICVPKNAGLGHSDQESKRGFAEEQHQD
ncbi:multiprotein-bridging factor 1 family protein [Cyclobacterium xiamenense]|uniref:helix-turn-helix domain-containing protein n=1 Tax=Cyclobacterium xiamenense TaxID=1297121 RepID=UPI0035D0EF0D